MDQLAQSNTMISKIEAEIGQRLAWVCGSKPALQPISSAYQTAVQTRAKALGDDLAASAWIMMLVSSLLRLELDRSEFMGTSGLNELIFAKVSA
jgi:hypothetical protein